MSDTVEHYGQVLDEDRLPAAIHQALTGRAQVPHELFPMRGAQWTLELLEAVAGTPLEAVVAATLAEALDDDDPEQREQLFEILAARPQLVPAPAQYAAFVRAVSDGPEASIVGARTVAAQVLSGNLSYSLFLRRHAANPRLRQALADAYVVYDHAWFLTQVGPWLHGELQDVLGLLSSACAPLSLGELRVLRDELRALALSDSAAELVEAYFEEIEAQPSYAERGLAIRWT